jgi:hypothetical protein
MQPIGHRLTSSFNPDAASRENCKAASVTRVHGGRGAYLQLERRVLSKVARVLVLAGGCLAGSTWAAPTCPLSYGNTDAAKSHKLYLYFPVTDDATYPYQGPALHFDVAQLDSTIGTTSQLRDRIHDIVVDDFCEFNVQVLQSTTNPDTLTSPPALRHIEAIGSDATGGAWGLSPTSNADVLRGRVWGGYYVTCEGGNGTGGCSSEGSLSGANSTLDRWAQAIGGTAAHESGHTYGLVHTDEDPTTGCDGSGGAGSAPGEDAYTRHLMPAGCNLDGNARASYRRHFSDRGFGILASNMGLSVQTMHNWDLVNPNSASARSLSIDFLSSQSTMNVTWSWSGSSSPWINPTVVSTGTAIYRGTTYNAFRITWSTPNPAWAGGASGSVSGGGQFHIGATFTDVDFNAPDPIIIQNLTLFDAASHALALHPRLPIYDAGTPDAPDGSFALHFQAPGGQPLQLRQAVIYQLPRVASIESMNANKQPTTFDGHRIHPWKTVKCQPSVLKERIRCVVANLKDPPHVFVSHKLGEPNVVDCSKELPRSVLYGPEGDSPKIPDNDRPICAGTARDPFPSTTVYIIATFVDPNARHWDRKKKAYVKGPVTATLYYQFAGIRDVRRFQKESGKLSTEQ